ncbi:MAG TPA: PilN domain-containing protein [Longimicrobiales bacterium]|nr:PilN domain-containing protein [Longimicrobiales bacterium]
MIEINLLPGTAKRQKRTAAPKLSRASKAPRPKAPSLDRSRLYVVLAWVVGVGALGYLQFGSAGRLDQLTTDAAAARADSTRLHALRVLNDSLLAQRDTIAAKLQVIQEIDAGRYHWSHILDEVSRALPAYTWLVSITDATGDAPRPQFRIEGRTGNTFALAKFMQDLEASSFLRGVTLASQEQTVEAEKSVYIFVLQAAYEEPPPDAIQTQPLFSTAGDLADESPLPAGAAGQED